VRPFHRRKAQRLAQLLDGTSGLSSPTGARHRDARHHSHSALDAELAGHVRLTEGLTGAAGSHADPTPEFRTSLRSMLLATAERDGIGSTAIDDPTPEYSGKRARPRTPVLSSRRTRGAILVGLCVGALAFAGMSAASDTAMPGDPLYGVKRSTENARLALAGSAVSKGQLLLEFARNRLTEARVIRSTNAGMFDDMDTETRAAVKLLMGTAMDRHDAAPLDLVDGFVQAQRADLTGLNDSPRVRQSMALLDRIAARSAAVRAAVRCGTGTVRTDDLGPLPGTCQVPLPGGMHRPSGTGPGPTERPGPMGGSSTGPTGAPKTDQGVENPPTNPSPSPSGLLNQLLPGLF
jgi:hypothetical protein